MKKETIIAIFFGVLFGSLVALFLLVKNKEFQLTKTETIAPTEKVSKTKRNIIVSQKPLEISEPQDGAIINNKKVSIKGRAGKDALMVIQSPIKDIVLKNDK